MNLRTADAQALFHWRLANLTRQMRVWLTPLGAHWPTWLAVVGCTVGSWVLAYAMAADLPIAGWLMVAGGLAAALGVSATSAATIAVGARAIRRAPTRYQRVRKANLRSMLIFSAYGLVTCGLACLMAAGLLLAFGPQPAIVVVAGVLASMAIACFGSALSVRPRDNSACLMGTGEPRPAIGFVESIRRGLSATARRESCLPTDGSGKGYGNIFALSVILERGAHDDSAGRFKSLDRLSGLAPLPELRRRARALVRIALPAVATLVLAALIGFPGADALGRLSRPYFPDPLDLFEPRPQESEASTQDASPPSGDAGASGASASASGERQATDGSADAGGDGSGTSQGGGDAGGGQGSGAQGGGAQAGGTQNGEAGSGGGAGDRSGDSRSGQGGADDGSGGQGQEAQASASQGQDGAAGRGQAGSEGDGAGGGTAQGGGSGSGRGQAQGGQSGSGDDGGGETAGGSGAKPRDSALSESDQASATNRPGETASGDGRTGGARGQGESGTGDTGANGRAGANRDGTGSGSAAGRAGSDGPNGLEHAAGAGDGDPTSQRADEGQSERGSGETRPSTGDSAGREPSAAPPKSDSDAGRNGRNLDVEQSGEGSTKGTGDDPAPPDPSDLPDLRDVAPAKPSPSDGRTVMVDGQAQRYAGEGAPAEVIELTPSFPNRSAQGRPAREHQPRQVLPSWIDRLTEQ